MIFFGLTISAIFIKRGSRKGARALVGLMVQKGKFSLRARASPISRVR